MSLLDKVSNVDHMIFSKLNGEWHNPFLDTVLPFLRQSYLWIPLYTFLIIFSFVNFKEKGIYWSLFFILTAILSDYISSTLIKGTVMRLRPCQDPLLMHHIRLLTHHCPVNSSFTSSHATNHFAAAMYIFTTFKKPVSKWWSLLFIWALLICYTQVYVGVHFPGDIIGGTIAGLIIGYLPAKIFNKKIGLKNKQSEAL